MRATIEGRPAFAHVQLELDPGEQIQTEADAMASMAHGLELRAQLNGSPLAALARKLLGGESLFVSLFRNPTDRPLKLTLVQATPGDIARVELRDQTLLLQPGAYLASTSGLTLGLEWAGLVSAIAREGFFRLRVSGTGTLFYGAYGALLERVVSGEQIVDTGHLVAYEPSLRLRLQLAGGLFSSLFGGEGMVTRVEGRGKLVLQTRSLPGLAAWLNPRL
jgi:uncharacterized protein (TIGR00266 family)